MLFQTHFLFFGASQKTTQVTTDTLMKKQLYLSHIACTVKKRKLKFNQLDAIRFLDVFVH